MMTDWRIGFQNVETRERISEEEEVSDIMMSSKQIASDLMSLMEQEEGGVDMGRLTFRLDRGSSSNKVPEV